MATTLLGTDANNSLVSLVWGPTVSQVDVQSINKLILNDLNARHPIAATSGLGGFIKEGLLFVPNRGELRLYPGDVVGVDTVSGQVILLSAYGLSAGPWNNA